MIKARDFLILLSFHVMILLVGSLFGLFSEKTLNDVIELVVAQTYATIIAYMFLLFDKIEELYGKRKE